MEVLLIVVVIIGALIREKFQIAKAEQYYRNKRR